MIKKILIQTYYTLAYYIPNIFTDVSRIVKGEKAVSIVSFLDTRWGRWKKQNWGDDMNVYLIEALLHKKVTCYNTSVLSWLFCKVNYSLIGSVLQGVNKNTIVWGSGLISEREIPKCHPKKIHAVRGPLSRKLLIDNGFDCPEIYGDPILLLPHYYVPNVEKKYEIGIVPHFYDEFEPMIQDYLRKHPKCHLISMSHYDNWKDVIDGICSCKMILSSSLHGIIVSDAYGIPNVWVEFSRKVFGNGFKFRDYFASVNRKVQRPVPINNNNDYTKAMLEVKNYNAIKIDLRLLIDSCPFNIHINHENTCL